MQKLSPGRDLTIRNENGEATHELSANGDVTHTGTGIFLGGVVVGDTVIAPVDTTGESIDSTTSLKKIIGIETVESLPEIGLSASGYRFGVYGTSINSYGVSGQSKTGIGVFGYSVTNHGY